MFNKDVTNSMFAITLILLTVFFFIVYIDFKYNITNHIYPNFTSSIPICVYIDFINNI